MLLFGYGSLINEESLQKTVPSGRIVDVGYLSGFERVFNFKSPYRHNPDTGVYSSVLNIREASSVIAGAVIQLSEEDLGDLLYRERGYEKMTCTLEDGREVQAFVSLDNDSYEYVLDDLVQQEYLDLCLKGAEALGNDVLENFMQTTFIRGRSVKEFLAT